MLWKRRGSVQRVKSDSCRSALKGGDNSKLRFEFPLPVHCAVLPDPHFSVNGQMCFEWWRDVQVVSPTSAQTLYARQTPSTQMLTLKMGHHRMQDWRALALHQ
eukprot:4240496-Amphidinium_carterae.2